MKEGNRFFAYVAIVLVGTIFTASVSIKYTIEEFKSRKEKIELEKTYLKLQIKGFEYESVKIGRRAVLNYLVESGQIDSVSIDIIRLIEIENELKIN